MARPLSVLIVIAFTFSLAAGHGDDSHYPKTQDVVVKSTKVSGNVYMLQGRGGNIGALVGMEGILIVDDDYKTVSEKLRDALKELGSPSPKFILNTHWHGDHTEGNHFFGKESMIIAHLNVRRRLLDPPVIFGRRAEPYPPFALPMITYSQTMTVHFNGEEVRLVHFPGGHTDGDTVVFFTKSNVVHLGDDFFVGRFPFVDIDSGGSVQGLIANVAKLLAEIPADAKLIPGHGPLATIADLKKFHQMLIETSDVVQNAMKKGMSLADIKKAGLPERYKEAGSGFIKTDQWIEIVHRSYSMK